MVQFILNEQQAQNLVSYLNRADIKGSEAPAWMNLMQTIIEQASQQKGGSESGNQ